MLKTISNEWRRARGQFVRANALGAAIVALVAAPQAEAAIIKLVCDVQYVSCIGAEGRGVCGRQEQFILSVDIAKNLVGDRPVKITDDYISWTWIRPLTNFEKDVGNINRKTGGYENRLEETRNDGVPVMFERRGTCQLAPQNKF